MAVEEWVENVAVGGGERRSWRWRTSQLAVEVANRWRSQVGGGGREWVEKVAGGWRRSQVGGGGR